VENGIAYFPDAVTSRGLKHLKELQREAGSGNRSVMFYLVQRMDAKAFKPAGHIDSDYDRELKKSVKKGVEILVYDVILDLNGISLNRKLPFIL
jgi:sugar fermentation stimulation protein A